MKPLKETWLVLNGGDQCTLQAPRNVDLMIVRKGDHLQLECEAMASESYQWFRAHDHQSVSDKNQTGMLDAPEEGVYFCRVENKVANAESPNVVVRSFGKACYVYLSLPTQSHLDFVGV